MSKWIAEFELEDGDTMPEHMDLEYKGARIDFHCKPQEPCEDCISREDAIMCMTGEYVADMTYKPEDIISKHIQRLRALPPVTPQEPISQG